MIISEIERSPLVARINVYMRVIYALMLRDMRTRFGGSHWGYHVTVLWPVSHIFLLVGVMVFRGMPSPMGDSAVLFIASGAMPALIFQYTSREVMKAMMVNKPLTYYPQVKIFDVVVARLIVEVVKGFTALVIVFAIIAALGVNPIPAEPFTAMCGYCIAILLGVGIGTVNVSIVTVFPGWVIGYILFGISMYITSGVFFLPHYFPPEIYHALKWNPIVQIIEWVRIGYEPTLPVEIDVLYLLIWCGASFSLGLILERTLVRRYNN